MAATISFAAYAWPMLAGVLKNQAVPPRFRSLRVDA